MLMRRCGSSVLVWAPAKVNLFLEVSHRRPDGYHELRTLMVRIDAHDALALEDDPAGDLRLTCDLPSLSTGPDNLVLRAAQALRQRAGLARGARISLAKRIPMAAGLAGGSTDGAATLAGLNELWGLGWSSDQLAQLGAELGSDVPFFFCPAPAAWCTGRGEIVEPVTPGCHMHLVVASPGVGLSTAEVYRNLTLPGEPVSGERMRRAVEGGDVKEIGQCLHNRLQEPAEKLCPQVARLRERLAALAPAGVLMSGSGSSVFALCNDAAEALRIARGLEGTREEWPGLRVSIVRSCD
jgi:4-diphosphocytidyl-2-C-methyl-D-erythritol kinase